jgi:Uma2 family endonuclease
MSIGKPRSLIEITYEAAAQDYLRSLPPEHFMEALGQSRQREITLESLALVKAQRPDMHVFNEMLVQYPVAGQRRPGQVVPDNMVVLSNKPIGADSSFNTPLEPAGPFWVLEYVSKNNKRKDYEDNFDKYEKDLRVPYFLMFYPDIQELTLYRHNGQKYVSVAPSQQGRYAIHELKLEVGLLDQWVRFWYEGRLLPLPADLQTALNETQRQLAQEKEHAARAVQEAEQEKRRADEMQRRLLDLERQLRELRGPS